MNDGYKELADVICDTFGLRLMAFNPGFLFTYGETTLPLPLWFVERLVKELRRGEDARLHLDLLQARGVDNWPGYCSLPDRDDYDTEAEWETAISKAARLCSA